jgi:hypothetical protein
MAGACWFAAVRQRSATSWVRFSRPGRYVGVFRCGDESDRLSYIAEAETRVLARRVHTALSPRSRVGHERSLVAEELLLEAGIRC